jgi:hypothetical protein
MPEVYNLVSYIEDRVTRQIEQYYRPQAARQDQLLRRARRAELWLAVLGAASAAVAGVIDSESLAVWVPVLTTISAAVTAHAAAERYEFLVVEYLRTARELERLRLSSASLRCGRCSGQRFVMRLLPPRSSGTR